MRARYGANPIVRGAVLASGGIVLAIGCGLDVVAPAGDTPDLAHDAAIDRVADTQLVPIDAPVDVAVVTDAAADATVDAGCTTVTIDDPLSSIDETRWLRTGNDPSYPTVFEPAAAGKPMVALVQPLVVARRSGLWLRETVPIRAFDISFDYLVTCQPNTNCGNGLGIAWLDTRDPTRLAEGEIGPSLNMPPVAGGAVTVSLRKDFEDVDDKDRPVLLRAHAMTMGLPGTVLVSAQSDAFARQLRTVTIRLRNGTLTVTNGGAQGPSLVAQTSADFIGFVGFVAASNTVVTEGAFVSSFHGEFHSCDP